MTSDLLSGMAALLRSDFAEESNAGFPTVRRIPSTDAVKFLDYFTELDASARATLLDRRARLGAIQFYPSPAGYKEAVDLNANDPALAQYRTTLQSGHFAYGLRYTDLRMARATLNDPESMAHMAQARATLNFQPRDDPPRELTPESDIRKIQSAKAPLLRKLMEKAFGQLFAPQKTKLPGGETRYTGSLGATELTVSADFSSRFAQLHWHVKMTMANPALRAFRVEDFWGGRGWDYLTEENASRSIDLLCERIVYLVKLKERIDALSASA